MGVQGVVDLLDVGNGDGVGGVEAEGALPSRSMEELRSMRSRGWMKLCWFEPQRNLTLGKMILAVDVAVVLLVPEKADLLRTEGPRD